MNNINLHYDELRNHTIGTVEFVSPKEIKILLELNAPQNTAINTGVPSLFPKINGFVLVPNEGGALVGIITWIGIEYSAYPKRKGFKDFGLIDLPFPLRKMSISPLGVLKKFNSFYKIERGVYSYPSVGDAVILPTVQQLQSIVENRDENACIKIGTSPFAANANVMVSPDKIFGRHIAVLGNTGSGKSCSVAGLIRWSLNIAQKEIQESNQEKQQQPNSRFIILDPNGEYTNTFNDFGKQVHAFKVNIEDEDIAEKLKVPAWMWNSYEWSSVTKASDKTQRPLLRRALRELRLGNIDNIDNDLQQIRRYLTSFLVILKKEIRIGPSSYANYPGKQNLGEFLKSSKESLVSFFSKLNKELQPKMKEIIVCLTKILDKRKPNDRGYYPAFNIDDLNSLVKSISDNKDSFGELEPYQGNDEDSPTPFQIKDLPNHLDFLANETNTQQFLDFYIMRLRTIIEDTRMSSIISDNDSPSLQEWLETYIGGDDCSITIIDLSIVPIEILHIVISVISRITFEALQRYRRKYKKLLPTVMVVEEAHNFITKTYNDNESISASQLCAQSFEKIAKEGRKFGLGLMLSSQRPSELSATVLSQCNTFLLHRIVNDRDQELVKKLVPDSLGGILNELPVLPTKKAILLGWAAPVPVLVDINELKKEHRPDSKDPDYWKVWTRAKDYERKVNWKEIADEWQNQESE